MAQQIAISAQFYKIIRHCNVRFSKKKKKTALRIASTFPEQLAIE
jgi:hypothetical protein